MSTKEFFLRISIFLFASLLVLMGCDKNSPTEAGKSTVGLQILPEIPVAITQTPLQLQALIVYSDSSTADVTNGTTWALSFPDLGYVDNLGQFHASQQGSSQLIASYMGDADTTVIQVGVLDGLSMGLNYYESWLSPGWTLALDCHAWVDLPGSSSAYIDVTSQVGWLSFNSSVAEVNQSGMVTGISVGYAQIEAVLDTFSAQVNVHVGTLDSVLIDTTTYWNSEPVIYLPDSTKSLGAYAYYSAYYDTVGINVSGYCDWVSENPSVLEFANENQANQLVAHMVGESAIHAIYHDVSSDTVVFKAIALDSIQISPGDTTVNLNHNIWYTAVGFYSDGNTYPPLGLEWFTSDSIVVEIEGPGWFRAVGLGNSAIHTEKGDIQSNISNVTVVE